MPSFVSGIVGPSSGLERALWLVFRGNEIVARDADEPLLPSHAEIAAAKAGEAHYLGALDGVPCFARALAQDAELPAGFSLVGLRPLFPRVREELWTVAGRALQVLEWDRTTRFCGACGAATERVDGERARRCPACALTFYPRIAPAIIVLVHRGDEAILATAKNFPLPFYSTLAGFAEPGESLEETLAREVFEEVGVRVKDARYFGSQPWPFPHSLMIGFHAAYESGEIAIDPVELADAKWFRFDALPRVPPRPSIARALIDDWVESRSARSGL